jgi:hypothetical protein
VPCKKNFSKNPSKLKLILILEVDRTTTYHPLWSISTTRLARLGAAVLLLAKHAFAVPGFAFQCVGVLFRLRGLGLWEVWVFVG